MSRTANGQIGVNAGSGPGFRLRLTNWLLTLMAALVAPGCASTDAAGSGDSTSPDKAYLVRYTIYPSFDPGIRYQVQPGDPDKLIYIEFAGQTREGEQRPRSESSVDLSQEQMSRIEARLEKMLDGLPDEDGIQGFDGALWSMEAHPGEPVEHDAWVPGFNTEKRGYTRFVDLYFHLRDLVDQQQREGAQ